MLTEWSTESNAVERLSERSTEGLGVVGGFGEMGLTGDPENGFSRVAGKKT